MRPSAPLATQPSAPRSGARAKLISALAKLETKRDKNPPKKHGNIPL